MQVRVQKFVVFVFVVVVFMVFIPLVFVFVVVSLLSLYSGSFQNIPMNIP